MLGLGLLSDESSLRNPAPPGRLTQIRRIRKKPKTKHEDGGSINGLRPIGSLRPTSDLRPAVVNRHGSVSCNIR